MFRRSVALVQRVIGRGFRCRPRPMTRWGSLAVSRWGHSQGSRPQRKTAPAARKQALSLRSSQARNAPFRGLPRPRTPAQPCGLGYALLKLRGSGFMARALPCALLPPSAPPCSLLLPKVATCPLVFRSGGMIPLSGLAPTSFKTRAHSSPKIGVRSGLGSAPATLRLCLLFARGKAQPPAGLFFCYRLENAQQNKAGRVVHRPRSGVSGTSPDTRPVMATAFRSPSLFICL